MDAWCNDPNWMRNGYGAGHWEDETSSSMEAQPSEGASLPQQSDKSERVDNIIDCPPLQMVLSDSEDDSLNVSDSLDAYTFYIELVDNIYDDYPEIVRSSTPVEN